MPGERAEVLETGMVSPAQDPERAPAVASLQGLMLPRPMLAVGEVVLLAGRLAWLGVHRPFNWGLEFVHQLAFTLRSCLFPMILTSFALAFGPIGVQASGFFDVFGTYDRLGSVYELTEVRWFGPLVVGIVLAGAAGTASCADLGARVVRDEISALQVMGIDPLKALVLPRVLALFCAGLLMYVFAVLSGLLGAVVVLHQHHQPLGPTMSNFFSNATALELTSAVIKVGIYGAVIALISCYKGITVSGGPEGVGRAVNQSVVVGFVALGFIDYAFTQVLLATHPVLSQVRG